MDRAELAAFLRRRREALRPFDVGLPRGRRRRTEGLRREEVASLAGMSADYYARLEQQRGPQPSAQMLAAIARALRLTIDERDHLFRLGGQPAPARIGGAAHVSPALLRVLDRLHDTPAMVVSDLQETLAQNDLAKALVGEHSGRTGRRGSLIYRWFTDPAAREIYPPEAHERHGRVFVSNLRDALGRRGPESVAAELVRELRRESDEFAELWSRQEVAVGHDDGKVIVHPELGPIAVHCQVLHTDDRTQALLIFTATPGSDDAGKLELLGVLGSGGFAEPLAEA